MRILSTSNKRRLSRLTRKEELEIRKGKATTEMMAKENELLRTKLEEFKETAKKEIEKYEKNYNDNQGLLDKNLNTIKTELDRYENSKQEKVQLNKDMEKINQKEEKYGEDINFIEKKINEYDDVMGNSVKDLEKPLKKVEKVG